MLVQLENTSTLERKLTARISVALLESQVRARLLELAKTVHIKGFRPGRIPANVVAQRFGAQVQSEVLTAAISSSWQEIVGQQNLRPALSPVISVHPADGEQVEYTAVFEVMPELGQVDVSGLSLTRYVGQVEESDIDQWLATAHGQQASSPPSENNSTAGNLRDSEALRTHEHSMKGDRVSIRATLERKLFAALADRNKANTLHHLLAAHPNLEVPKGLVELERKARTAQAATDGVNLTLPAATDAAAYAMEAHLRVCAFVLLSEIARQNAIAPEQKRINATLAEIASGYQQPERVVELYAQDSELMASLRNRVVEDQAIEWVVANANVTEQRLTFNDLVQRTWDEDAT